LQQVFYCETNTMTNVPLFLEMCSDAHTDVPPICQHIRSAMASRGHRTLPMANSLHEFVNVRIAMRRAGLKTGLVIVNTYKARPILSGLDALLDDCPVLFLRRELYGGQSGLQEYFDLSSAGESTLTRISKMRARLAAVWNYGSLTCPHVAESCACVIDTFLSSNDFRPIERLSKLPVRVG
jgi:hypothetical protein